MNTKQHLAVITNASLIAIIVNSTSALAGQLNDTKGKKMTHHAYVYTELQISVPFHDVPWKRINTEIKKQPGFINKTWLSGTANQSAGGFYTFDTIEHAQQFVTEYFPLEAKHFNVAQTTRVFDAAATEAASKDMNSMHYKVEITSSPKAFVYTELQLSALPFNKNIAWQEINTKLKQQTGLIAKTWLSGINTGTVGGFYAFDSLENAQNFAINYFPTRAKALNAAYITKIFDADITELASRDMQSPFYRQRVKQ